MNYKIIREQMEDDLSKLYGLPLAEANLEQLFRAAATTANDILRKKRKKFNSKVKENKSKRVYYLCMEFLVGKSFKNNVYNLGLEDEFKKLFAYLGYEIEDVYDFEPDAGLGNGGLGRLAACYMESFSSCNYPAMGHSLRYEYGIFKQKIENNWQNEMPDIWLPIGNVWLNQRSDKTYNIRFGGRIEEVLEGGRQIVKHLDYREVEAMPYDMMISGKGGEAVSVLRLWRSQNIKSFDLKAFSVGNYLEAMKDYNEADLITKILYPPDEHPEGKLLRIKQQYFLVSAAVQNIVSDHLRYYGDIRSFADHVAIHINDTHPALAIPELMRIFIDEHEMDFDEAWEIVRKTVAYTNHTVMVEALERWSEDAIKDLLPRLHHILVKIDENFRKKAKALGLRQEEIDNLAIIGNNEVRMANLCVISSHKVNGVSKLHSQIIKDQLFNGYYQITPDKFTNVTNGIAYRRWLCDSNPRLTSLLEETIGSGFIKDALELENLLEFIDNEKFLQELSYIKYQNKREFSKFLYKKTGIVIDPKSRFDVQVKRFHEYKRQLLNVLKIIALYIELEENPDLEVVPQTFIFGGKAAPSYYQAKEVIELINSLAAEISKHPKIREKLNLVFVEDYKVSVAEILIPASEVSQQISLAGKEASGTGNMKFMMNGALTLGTLDGANVEIHEQVGSENIFIFGMKTEEVQAKVKDYNPQDYLLNPTIKKVIERLNKGFNSKNFNNISDYLLSRHHPDPYMCLADFESYLEMHKEMDKVYQNKKLWNQMSLINIAKSGVFSADRSVKEYAEKIWNLKVIE